jgi:hypothetical protein
VSHSDVSTEPVIPRARAISGRWVVLAMFAAGVVATVTMFVYWDLHTRPFRPLTEAVGREFRHSLPKVEGGRHKRGALTLRVSLRVPFTPTHLSLDAQQVVRRVVELAREHTPFADFEQVQVLLIEMRPEAEAVRCLFEFSAEQLRGEVPFETQTTDENHGGANRLE